MLSIFARLNLFGKVKFSRAEKWEIFWAIQMVSLLSIAHDHLKFWRTNKIFSDQSIARMQEV